MIPKRGKGALESKLGLYKSNVMVSAIMKAHVATHNTLETCQCQLGLIATSCIKKFAGHVRSSVAVSKGSEYTSKFQQCLSGRSIRVRSKLFSMHNEHRRFIQRELTDGFRPMITMQILISQLG